MTLPAVGSILAIGRAASVQFARGRGFAFRVLAVDERAPNGWLWLRGQQLDASGNEVEVRSILVQAAGLRVLRQAG